MLFVHAAQEIYKPDNECTTTETPVCPGKIKGGKFHKQ